MRRGIVLTLTLLLAAGCGDDDHVQYVAAPALEPLQIHADADWVRDRSNRVVLLRGANYSGLEFGNFPGADPGPKESDFAQLASWGVNVVRLPIAWHYLEPIPNQFDESYLSAQVDPVIAWAERYGIRVILDMHHYYWSQCIGGLGAPPWVCDGHNYGTGEHALFRAMCEFFRGVAAPDGRPLMDHYVDAWRLVAHHYAHDERILGHDYFNEPYGVCFGFDGTFERTVLNPYYRRIREVIRSEGAARTFFYCPTVTRNLGTPTAVEPMGPDVVYMPHLYGNAHGAADMAYNGDAAALAADYDLAAQEARTLGGPLVPGEYGGNADPPGFQAAVELFYRDTYAELDRRILGGTFWAYFASPNGFSVVDTARREKGEIVNLLARPYARRIAGIPTAMHFDLDTKVFTFAFRNDPDHAPSDPTEIFVPMARYYPDGVAVEVSAGDRYEVDAAANRLLLRRGTASTHTVRIAAPRN